MPASSKQAGAAEAAHYTVGVIRLKRWLPADMPRLFLALGLAGLAAPGLLAQPTADQPPTITGTLVDERGAPAADVEVVLRPYPSAYLASIFTSWANGTHALPEAADRTALRP